MDESSLAALLQVRESDIVRLCGLAAAAQGLDLASRHLVASGHRSGLRVSAQVSSESDVSVAAWFTVVDGSSPAEIQWSCSCQRGGRASDVESGPQANTPLACEHVAAVLSTWIRQPADFEAEPFRKAGVATHPPSEPHTKDTAAREGRTGRRSSGPELGTSASWERLSLREELTRLSEDELRAVAERVAAGADELEDARNALVERVSESLSDRDRVAHLLQRLGGRAETLLRAVALLGGGITAAELDGLAQRAGTARGSLEASTVALERHGLLFRTVGAGRSATAPGDHNWRWFSGWRVPDEVAQVIGRTWPRPDVLIAGPAQPAALAERGHRIGPLGRPTRIRKASARQLCAAFALLIHYPPRGQHQTGVSTLPAQARPLQGGHTRPLPLVAGDPPTEALAAWARGARVPVGLARMARRTLQWAEHTQSDHPIANLDRLPDGEWPLALRAAFSLWLSAETYAELTDLTHEENGVRARCDPSHPALRLASLAAETRSAREFVMRLLSHAPVGEWVTFEQLSELVWWLDPFFLRGRELALGHPSWWLEDGATGRPLRSETREEWERADARYLNALFTGPFHWWGVVDLALDQSGSLRAIRVTPFGAFLLRTADAPGYAVASLAGGWRPVALVTRDAALAVQPLAGGWALLEAMAPWASITGLAGGRLLVRLSPDRMCRSLDAGLDPEVAFARLRDGDAYDHTKAARAVEEAFVAYRSRYGQARIISGMMLVEAEDEAILREALSAAPAIMARARYLAPHLALLPQAAGQDLERALNRRRIAGGELASEGTHAHRPARRRSAG